MLESKDLLDAMTKIDDTYIQSAHDFGQNRIHRLKRVTKRGVIAASIAAVLIATTVYGAVLHMKQLHVSSYNNVAELTREHDIKPWDSAIPVIDGTFDEDIFLNLQAESIIDILSDGEISDVRNQVITNGTDADAWVRKLTEYGDHLKAYYEAYEYENLADALLEYRIALDLTYIQENYPRVAGEYGCDFAYSDESKKECLQQRFFSGYTNPQGNFVSIEYCVDNTDTNENPYFLFAGKSNVRYYVTSDGVEVFLTTDVGASGKTYVSAFVYTEHGTLFVGMYGEFEGREAEEILNSLNIAEGMNIDVGSGS